MLKSIKINNFRCLKDVIINFEATQTLIVGENDAGKTSVVDVLRILFDGEKIEAEDFCYGETEIFIKVNINDNKYNVKYLLEDNIISTDVNLELSHNDLNIIKDTVNGDDFAEDNSFDQLKDIAKSFNITVRANSLFTTLKNNVNSRLDEKLDLPEPVMIDSNLPSIKIYILDGKHMEDISLFINERYFKDKKNNIWDENISEGKTIEQFVIDKLEEHSNTIKRSIDTNGIKEKIQDFLPELSDIKIKSSFARKDISIGVNVMMLHGEQEILISKKGDGTKRRITLALLGIDDIENERAVYIFDEVDTHLHVKAQKELMCKLSEIHERGNQIILTSHSPFIINTVKPKQIRAIANINNRSRVNTIDNIEDIDKILSSLGIENTYLFFAKKIILVEGKTEEVFLPRFYELTRGNTLYNNLIKIINVDGIRNIPGFAKALLELNDKKNIYILIDNDIEDDTQQIVDKLSLLEEHIFKIGKFEFEDSFSAEYIYNAWKNYVESNGRSIGEQWNVEMIESCLANCLNNGQKFSKDLRMLNAGCKEKLTKPKLGIALAEYCNLSDIDCSIVNLIEKLG